MRARAICCIFFLAGFFVAGFPTAPLGAQAVFDSKFDGTWLVLDKQFRGKIYLPQNPAPDEREAAEVLACWIERTTGAVAVIDTESDGALLPGVYVGATAQAARRSIRAPDRFGDAWHWQARSRHALFILGNSPLATRLAVGDFIQRHLGVMFLLPGEWGAEWEQRRSISMPLQAHTQKPAYAWRRLGMAATPAQRDWMRNNGLGNLPPFSHALHKVFDDKAAAMHPEFFPTLGGVIRLPSGRGGYEPQPNLAAPGAATHAAQRAADYFQNDLVTPSFALGITDNMTWDESAATRALAPYGRYFRGKPDYSNYVFSFMNRVATALWPAPDGIWDATQWRDAGGAVSSLPPVPSDKLLGCLAYYHCERTPDFPLHPNVFPVLTADRSQWRDLAFRAQDRELIRRWARSGVRHFGLYDYYYGNDYLIPRIFLEHEIDSIRWGARQGASLFYAEIVPNWGFDGPKAWLAARLLQDPGQSGTLLLRRYFNEAYGPAAPAMRELFDIAEQYWNAQPGPARWIKFWRMENMGALVSEAQQHRMRAVLTLAEDAFPSAVQPGSLHDDDRVLRQQVRVRMTSLAFAVTERFLEWYRVREQLLQRNPTAPAEVRELLLLLEQEVTLRKQFLDTMRRWDAAACNPGVASHWRHFFTGSVGVTVVERLLRVCELQTARHPDDENWRAVFQEAAFWASQRGLLPLVNAILRPAEARTLARDDFSAGSFRLPGPGSWAEGKPVTILRPPWRTVLFENQTLRFGFRAISQQRITEGFLRMTSNEQTTLSRDVTGVVSGGWIAARIFCRGRVNPGTYAALEMQFLDGTGNPLGGRYVSIIHPAYYDDWRPVACLAQAPSGAGGVRVSIRCMSQEADETLDWNDFSVEKLPAR